MASSDRERENVLENWKNVKKWMRKISLWTAGAFLLSSIYTVPTDSQGVIRRFGEYTKTTDPGIHLKIPYWVDRVTKVPVKKVQKEEFGFRTLKAGVDSKYLTVQEIEKGEADRSDLVELINKSGLSQENSLEKQAADMLRSEYLMLTGDLNMADVEWIIQYKIKDPV
ncbi:MAG: hypothetical protein KAJ72_07490, partial [Candidatus Heimdallarchaeota archaeon]|nr:hypothetical protein [Candidatus Heimdallarchaeota archaeon]